MFKFAVILLLVPAIFARTPVRECGGGQPLPTAVFFGSRTVSFTCYTNNLHKSYNVSYYLIHFVLK